MSDDLAQRAVACKGWRWMPGMLTQHGRICGAGYLVSDAVDEAGQPFVDCTDTVHDWAEAVPDLTDPATLGCLLALVREAWGCRTAYLTHNDGAWLVMRRDPLSLPLCKPQESEAAALVAALWPTI